METKSLLIGIISFMAGGLLVATAAVTFDKPESKNQSDLVGMRATVDSLKNKSGDDYDKDFLAEMIAHHEGAVAMAVLSKNQAKHNEIKQLSEAIIAAQQKEIAEMKQWQTQWGYGTSISPSHKTPSH